MARLLDARPRPCKARQRTHRRAYLDHGGALPRRSGRLRGIGMARLAAIALLKDAGIDLAPFEARAHWRRFEPNETLVDFDDVTSDVYFLVSGEVRVLIRTPSGKEVILGEM